MDVGDDYPLKSIIFLTKLYLRSPNMISNRMGYRQIRLLFYIKIEDYERTCSFAGKLTDKNKKIIFPWEKEDDFETLPSIEESIRRFKESLNANSKPS